MQINTLAIAKIIFKKIFIRIIKHFPKKEKIMLVPKFRQLNNNFNIYVA